MEKIKNRTAYVTDEQGSQWDGLDVTFTLLTRGPLDLEGNFRF